MKLKKILLNPRIIILILALIASLWALQPQPFTDGVAINSVVVNSSAALAGIGSPAENTLPTQKELITHINGREITNIDEYVAATKNLKANSTIQIRTDKSSYTLIIKEEQRTIFDNETKSTITETKGIESLGISVTNAATTNIRKGLDLQGGTRVLLEPAEEVDDETLQLIVDSLKQRLNVYGIADVTVTTVSSLGGKDFILVEIAGATQDEVKALISGQGKFEASIGNSTVFRGGSQDITNVCRTAQCSGLDPNYGCRENQGLHHCRFYFSITLSPEAAQRQAEATKNLGVIGPVGDQQLTEPLILKLDDQLFSNLSIGAELKGSADTSIQISGGGSGPTQEAALANMQVEMKQLQTILSTGSLPTKLNIERIDTISPTLGAQFVNNAIILALLTILVVAIVLVTAYRKITLAIPIVIAALSEVIIIMGVAAAIGWNIDLAAIAGIIVAIGTGVDDQIVIADETLKAKNVKRGWKERMKRAFFIIFTAYFTTVVAMIPLLFAGAGLVKGFALVTIIGVTIGVFITRPAFAKLLEYLTDKH